MLPIRRIGRAFSDVNRRSASAAAVASTVAKPLPENHCSNRTSTEWSSAKPFDSIPGPKPGLILGYYRHFVPKIGKYHGMEQDQVHISMNEEYGNIVRLRGLKTRNDLVCCYDPSDIETVFRNEGPRPMRDALHSIKYFRTNIRSDLFQGYTGTFTSDGEDWHKARSMINPILMQPRTVSHYIPHMDSVADDFVTRMRYLATLDAHKEMPKDFQNELAKWAAESVGVIALDCRIGMLDPNLSPESEKQLFINDLLAFFSLLYQVDVVPNLSLYMTTPTWKKHIKVMDRMCSFIQKQVQATMARIEKEGNRDVSIVEKLVNIDPKTVFGNAVDVITAGVETTSRWMGGILYLMAKHQDVQAKLKEEVHRALPTKDTAITKHKLDEMPYLRAVTKECMRHVPIVLCLMRKASKDLVLSGYQIPQGTDILLEQIPLAWNEKYFADAKQFKPERWLRGADSTGLEHNPWVYLPFGFGPRSCVGRRLASLEVEVLLAKIIRNFKLEWHHGDMKFKHELMYGIASPLQIRLTDNVD